jgi:hypothetical protein
LFEVFQQMTANPMLVARLGPGLFVSPAGAALEASARRGGQQHDAAESLVPCPAQTIPGDLIRDAVQRQLGLSQERLNRRQVVGHGRADLHFSFG